MSTSTQPGPHPPDTPAPTNAAPTPPVVLFRVGMAYGSRLVFKSLSCAFPAGKISVILGGSGSGKSTILRLIGGLVRPQSGAVLVDGQDITHLSERGLYKVREKLGMLFQGGAILDSYSVYDNVALPLREKTSMTEDQIAQRVRETLASVGVTGADRLLPGQLSGGMLRRVALARAIIRKPLILLCDEPFSGLDPLSIKRIETLLTDINKQFGITMIVVSHHPPSALRMGAHLLMLLGDRIVEGTPAELQQSRDPEVTEFLHEDFGPVSPAWAHRGAGR